MKPNAVPVKEGAHLKGVEPPAIRYALKTKKLNAARVRGPVLVLLDAAFKAYTPNPKRVGPRGSQKRAARGEVQS